MARTWLTRKPTSMDGRVLPGGLVVISDSETSTKGKRRYLCRCFCGNTCDISACNIRQKSCGCLKKDTYGAAAFRSVLCGYKKSAETRGYVWDISEDEFRALTSSSCFYCGTEPRTEGGYKNDRGKHNGLYIYNGLDRVDTSMGYTVDNVVPCCWFCNRAKNQMTISQWEEWSKRFVEYNLHKYVK